MLPDLIGKSTKNGLVKNGTEKWYTDLLTRIQANSYFDALMIVINFVEIPKGMNYPHRGAEYRKGKIFFASWEGELNLLSAFGGLNNNSRMRSVRRSCE